LNEIERETKKLDEFLSFKSLGTHKFERNLGKFDINTVLQIFKSDIKKINLIKLVNIISVDTALFILKNLHKYNKSYYVREMLKKSVSQNVLGNKNKKLFTI
jgi:hypothetical protein